MILVSFGLWFVFVFGLYMAFRGNPLHRAVAAADPGFLAAVEAVISGQKREPTEAEVRFIRGFSRSILIQLALFFLELVLLVHLWWIRVLPPLTFGLFIKDLLAISLGIVLGFQERNRGMITSILLVPRWALITERISAGLSAAGAFVLFLTVNDLIFL